ncbi:MAG: LamG domain-containing protein [Planctomycetota bacterium]
MNSNFSIHALIPRFATFIPAAAIVFVASHATPAASAQSVTVTAFEPNSWFASDSALGISGFVIEDFEDTRVQSGLKIQLSGGSADYGPSSGVPHVFQFPTDDPNVIQVLANGVWDGNKVLLNRATAPIPVGYVDAEWADMVFSFADGASSVGFSMEQVEVGGTQMTVTTDTGTSMFALDTIPNVSLGGGRNGYIRIDADAGVKILSVKIDNLNGDGFAFDHLAFKRFLPPLVSHWRFDETSGPTAYDSTGAFNGTLAGGAQFVAGGISNHAISLSRASNSFVNMGTSFPSFTAGDFTVSTWIKTTSSSANDAILTKHTSTLFSGYYFGINTSACYGVSGKAYFYSGSPLMCGEEPVSTTTINDGAWHHIVAVYESGGNVSIYVDGAPAEQSKAAKPMIAAAAALLIGGGTTAGGVPVPAFDGLIDEVQIYSGALTESQVNTLFASPGKSLELATAIPAAQSLLPTSVKLKLNATQPSKSTLQVSGFLDTGTAEVDFTLPATMTFGGYSVGPLPLVANSTGTTFTLQNDQVKFVIKPSKTGSSSTRFTAKVTDDIGGLIDPNLVLNIRFESDDIEATGSAQLQGGNFALGKSTGFVESPETYALKAKATVAGGGNDSLQLTLSLPGSATPGASSLTISFGEAYAGFVPAELFVQSGERYTFKGPKTGITNVTIDYTKQQLVIKAKGIHLGAFAEGENTVSMGMILDGESNVFTVKMIKKGTALAY